MIPRLSLSALVFVVAALIAVLVSTSGGSTSKARSSSAVSAISVEQTPLGDTLTDAQGRVLYRFAPDKPNMSTLSAAGESRLAPVHLDPPSGRDARSADERDQRCLRGEQYRADHLSRSSAVQPRRRSEARPGLGPGA